MLVYGRASRSCGPGDRRLQWAKRALAKGRSGVSPELVVGVGCCARRPAFSVAKRCRQSCVALEFRDAPRNGVNASLFMDSGASQGVRRGSLPRSSKL